MSKANAKRSGGDLKLADTDLKLGREGPYDSTSSSTQDEVATHINKVQKPGVTS